MADNRGHRTMLCVYAIVPAVEPTSLTVGRERLRVVRYRRIAAVVKEVMTRPSATPAILRSYDRTIRYTLGRYAAILPARFGTCVTSDAELLFILKSRYTTFARGLSRVRGRVQMTVRVIDSPGESGKARTAGRRAFSGGRPSGRDYLRARAREAAAAREVNGFQPVRDSVRRFVRAEVVERRAGVATIYHLVPRSAVETYRACVQAAGAVARLRMVVTGPWPPYAFAVAN